MCYIMETVIADESTLRDSGFNGLSYANMHIVQNYTHHCNVFWKPIITITTLLLQTL